MKVNGEQREDLTRIRGIGSVKQQWLRESLNIYTFQDLACLSVDEIESRFREKGHTASKREIKRWIVQAQQLATVKLSLQQNIALAEAELEEPSTLPTQKSELSQQVMASVDAEARKNNLSSTNLEEWQSFASFFVEFQSRKIEGQLQEHRTRVHYLEADKFQFWPDIENNQLQQWMLDQISKGIQQSPEIESPVFRPPMTVEIIQIQIFQPLLTERSMVFERGDRLFPGTINSGEPFALEIAFNLAELNVADLTQQQVTYHAQFYARHRFTGVVTHLGDTEVGTLIQGQFSYTARLPETTLESGVYRLQAIVKLQGVPAPLASFKIPVLQVL